MVQDIWRAAATMVAAHIRTHHYELERGLILIPRPHDHTVIIWVFGNDTEPPREDREQEIAHLRQRIDGQEMEELGYGASQDQHTWVLVLRTDNGKYHTEVGKAFHMEMTKAWLDEVVQEAWRVTHGAEDDSPVLASK